MVAKARGMYKLNKYSYVFATICRLGIVVAGYLGSIPLMLVFTVLTSLGEGPWQGGCWSSYRKLFRAYIS